MAKYIVHTIESVIVVREVEVADEFPGDGFGEARFRASLGGGEVIEDHPAAGPVPVTRAVWSVWDCEQVETTKDT